MTGFLLFILIFWPHLLKDEIEYAGEYKILPQSKVSLSGTSNVNKFSCSCLHDSENQVFRAEAISDEKMDFADTDIQLVVEYIDCKNRKMDKDLQKALKSELFPTVNIELETITINSGVATIGWNTVQAIINITLAGEKRKYHIDIKAKRLDGKILITGNKTLKMTDFNIVPPQVLFGMIKVNDLITFHFDLHVELTPKII